MMGPATRAAGTGRPGVWLLTYERMPDPEVGASWVRLGWLADTLRSEAGELHVFSRGDEPRPRTLERLWGGTHTRLPGLGSSPAPRFVGMMLLATPYLFARALRERPRLVLAHSSIYGPLLSLLRLLPEHGRPRLWLDVPWVTSSEVEQSSDPPPLRRRRKRMWAWLERRAVAAADLVTTANELMQALLDSPNGRRKMRILRNAGSVAESVQQDDEFLASLGVEADDTVCVFVGVLVHGRLLPLLRAFPRALEREPSLRLVVAGVGLDLERSRRLAGERTLFVGFRSGAELDQLLARADIAFTDCWHDDGFPMKIFLYMGAGKPMLIEDKPQLREVLRDDEHALFFSDEEELADKLVTLAHDAGLRRRLGEASRQLLTEEHTWTIRTEELRQLLHEVVPPGDGDRK
jgi:glycosyltransferase involved in cell wall biosynthesis